MTKDYFTLNICCLSIQISEQCFWQKMTVANHVTNAVSVSVSDNAKLNSFYLFINLFIV